MTNYELICCVVNDGLASKTLRIAKKYGVKGGTISFGCGAGSNRLLDMLGLDGARKEIVTMIIEKVLCAEAIKGISEEMEFEKPHRGIAFSMSVSAFIGSRNEVENNFETQEVKKSMYSIIYVIVDKGKAKDVIEAASKAGSKGGTIINARGAGIHEAQKLFSVEIEPEKEKAFIITKSELKDDIVASIREQLKIDEPGNGVLFVVDANEVYGVRE